MHSVAVRIRFEAGHRLPHLPGKCVNLHGHSWVAHLTATAPTLSPDDLVVDFTTLKDHVQTWADTHLDHGMILGATDPLADLLRNEGLKVYRVGLDPYSPSLRWPTVEALAQILGNVARDHLQRLATNARITRVTLSETENNAATWEPAP